MNISFECYCPTEWGQSLFLVGSTKELGSWKIENAIPLKSITEDKWKVIIELKASAKVAIEYKYFMRDGNRNTIFYEFGTNRKFTGNASRFGDINLKDLWRYHGNDQYVWTKSAFANVVFNRNDSQAKTYSIPAKVNSVIEFKVMAPRVGRDYDIAILGNCNVLGNWDESKAVTLNDVDFPEWKTAFNVADLPQVVEYKYVIVNKKIGKITTWEDGGNRFAYLEASNNNSYYQICDGLFHFSGNSFKKAGVAVPVFSLRTNESFGVGEFLDLKKLVNWAKKTSLKMIQVLPVNDTISTHGFLDSYPYKAISVFALHPLYLNIFKMGKIKDAGLMDEYLLQQKKLNKNQTVDYNLVLTLKLKYAKQLFKEKKTEFLKNKEFQEFFKHNKSWLEPYAAFCYLRDHLGTSDFNEWADYQNYKSTKVKALFNEQSKSFNEITYWYFVQFYLDKQLAELSSFARKNGIVLKGDIPIGISRHSVDAWYEPELFNFDGQAGAPPDDFSVDGQNWGFPTYNWKQMQKDNYQWWRNRLTKMAEYFDAYRIDHILGFFRIWEIPFDAVQGILGHFRPSIPFSKDELQNNGVWFDYSRLCKPYIRGHFLNDIFAAYTDEVIDTYLNETEYNVFNLKNAFKTQRLIYDHFVGEQGPEGLSEKDDKIMWGLIRLAADVVLLPADGLNEHFHPRISMHSTYSYKELDDQQKHSLNNVYIHYFYHRHEQFWKEQAVEKLPALVEATNMLICGEDLGMIPATVPEVMNQMGILSLEIQRMPKDPKKEFAHPSDAPTMSVCTTSTHDMATIRGWWEEDREKTQMFFNQQLGKYGDAPFFAEPWVCKDMILQHLYSPAMWTVFPIQDLLAMDDELRSEDTHGERINDPANPRHYWNYRMHLSLEDLLKANEFNKLLGNLVKETDRDTDY
ncbi:MAG: 4-alpha-glucanotransferase [Salinivirgaceae bacterium]|jgi:4-alpha-glucanotransferase|nr:4-alpha-glucanotransferase [Salinivirgaceae bacterium]